MSNKTYLNSIIVIAIFLVLIAIFGASNHFMAYYDPKGELSKKENKVDPIKPTPNPNPDPKPNTDGKEIHGYKCVYENCHVLDGTDVINNKYIFISDGDDNVVLFDITSVETKETYKSVSVTGNLYTAVDKDNKYGVISVYNDVENIVPFEYTLITYSEKKDNYVLTKNTSSFVADNRGRAITLTYNAQIIDYNDLYIITRTSTGEYHIFNFNNRTELTEYVNSNRLFIELVASYVGVVTDDYTYRLYDFQKSNNAILSYKLEKQSQNVHAIINNANRLEIYVDDTLEKTIDLQ